MAYIELYIDETGSPKEESDPKKKRDFTIGGVYAIYENKPQAREFNQKLHQEGVQYFYPQELPKDNNRKSEYFEYLYDHDNILYPKYSDTARRKKKEHSKDDIDIFMNVLKGYQDISVHTIHLTCPKMAIKNHTPLALNITMLKCLIELFLYEILLARNVDIKGISIFVATRVQNHSKRLAMKERFRYGIEFFPTLKGNYLSYYINSNTPYLLMKEVEDMHANKRVVASASFRLLGVTMIYQNSKNPDNRRRCLWEYSSDSGTKSIYKNKDIEKLHHIDTNNEEKRLIPLQRPMHYIADAMLSWPDYFNSKIIKNPESSTVGCMLETYDKENLPKFINASRLLDQDKYLEALQEIIAIEKWPDVKKSAPETSQPEIPQQGRKYILARLGKQAVPEISNEDFYHLVSTYKVQKAQQNKAQQGG